MDKNFNRWNEVKKKTNNSKEIVYFKKQEVWWTRTGLNIGIESNGKGEEFTRPVLIIKKHNKYSCLVVFLTTNNKLDRSKTCIDLENYPNTFIKLSQIKTIDSKRLVKKIFFLNQDNFERIKRSIREFNEL